MHSEIHKYLWLSVCSGITAGLVLLSTQQFPEPLSGQLIAQQFSSASIQSSTVFSSASIQSSTVFSSASIQSSTNSSTSIASSTNSSTSIASSTNSSTSIASSTNSSTSVGSSTNSSTSVGSSTNSSTSVGSSTSSTASFNSGSSGGGTAGGTVGGTFGGGIGGAGTLGGVGGNIGGFGGAGNTGGIGGTLGGNFGGGGSFGGSGGGGAVVPSAPPAKTKTCKATNGVQTCIPLIQPLGTTNKVSVLPGAGTFIDYFNDISGFLFTMAVGFCVVWVLIGAFMIMISGGPSGSMMGQGKTIMTWAIIGLIIVNFAGFILRTLNSSFFT